VVKKIQSAKPAADAAKNYNVCRPNDAHIRSTCGYQLPPLAGLAHFAPLGFPPWR